MTAVYFAGKYVREVSANLTAAEVAGRCLPPREGCWRTADRTQRGWTVRYFEPSEAQQRDWVNRPEATYAKPVQPRYAHAQKEAA